MQRTIGTGRCRLHQYTLKITRAAILRCVEKLLKKGGACDLGIFGIFGNEAEGIDEFRSAVGAMRFQMQACDIFWRAVGQCCNCSIEDVVGICLQHQENPDSHPLAA